MDWRLFMVPIVGAVIGYATNWIAVKMLFYPHHEKRLFGRKLPFTPGVIPKGKERLARAAGQVIEKHLLNEEILRPVLLSDPMREKIGQTLEDWKQGIGDKSVKDLLADSMGENKLEALAQETEERISDHITEKILAMDPAALLVDKLMEEARAMLADSMLGMMFGSSLLEKIGGQVRLKADEFIQAHLHDYVRDMVKSESDNIQNKTLGDLIGRFEDRGGPLENYVYDIYENLVVKNLPAILSALNFSRIVQDRINAMPVEEVEELVLYIMEKELAAVVNIGALIGFVLGLFNVLILKI